ncbi:MAG TPA: prolipoprotein diacylglyceryl transferase [Gemmatimonadales bacterium]|jgi:phosphatidylglycerol:prolipoprotein diacylglycerol transferase
MIFPLLAEIPFPGWDPVALHLGPISIRWYGLGYLAGFLIAGWILDRLGQKGFVALTKVQVSDLIAWLVVGVLLGGRLGYALFYEQSLLTHPLELVKIWQGGLSFHGGLAGVVIASWLFARKHKILWRRVADSLSLCIPAGIFLVRCANFVNAELYGRIARPTVPWAMRFPTDPVARALSPELARGGSLHWHEAFVAMKANGTWAQLAPNVPLRHPSQLYEALLEGVVIAAILWAVYLKKGPTGPRPGALAALFLLLYAIARFFVEFTRQPDAQLGFVLGPFSMGQLLSVGVIAGAAVLYWWPGLVIRFTSR